MIVRHEVDVVLDGGNQAKNVSNASSPIPRVSVLLPVHNGMPYMPLAVESILAQTFRDFELIVLDDGSTDESPEYLRCLSDPRVRYVRLERMRLVGALNHGLSLARAPLIARMDADDIALPLRFERQVAMFDSDPSLVLASVQFDRIDGLGVRIGEHRDFVGDAAIRWYLLFSAGFLHPGAMYRRDAVLGIGGYSKEFDVAEDYDLWTRLSRLGRVANSREVLMQYRSYGGGVSAMNRERQRCQSSIIAGRYAASMLTSVSADQWKTVRDAVVGVEPPPSEVRGIGRTFAAAEAEFRRSVAGDEEVDRCIELWQQRLRWRCLAGARAALPDVSLCWKWLVNSRSCGFGLQSVKRAIFSKRLESEFAGRSLLSERVAENGGG